ICIAITTVFLFTSCSGFRAVTWPSFSSWNENFRLDAVGSHTVVGGLTVDGENNVYVAGDTTDGLNGNVLFGTTDYFLIKYSSSGEKKWTRQLGAQGAETHGWSVTHDSANNVYVAGYTTGALNGNVQNGDYDLVVSKYSATGELLWTRQSGATGESTRSSD